MFCICILTMEGLCERAGHVNVKPLLKMRLPLLCKCREIVPKCDCFVDCVVANLLEIIITMQFNVEGLEKLPNRWVNAEKHLNSSCISKVSRKYLKRRNSKGLVMRLKGNYSIQELFY